MGAPELFAGDATEQEGDGSNGKNGKQSVQREQSEGGKFSGDDVEAAEVGEEQEAERALTLFAAEAVGGDHRSGEQGEAELEEDKEREEGPAGGCESAGELLGARNRPPRSVMPVAARKRMRQTLFDDGRRPAVHARRSAGSSR